MSWDGGVVRSFRKVIFRMFYFGYDNLLLMRRDWVDAASLTIGLFVEAPAEARHRFLIRCLCQATKYEHVLEFGVAAGKSINALADFWSDRTVWGFDSFEGLPEDWRRDSKVVIKKGTFAMKQVPDVRSNVRLVKGLFEETLPLWLSKNPGNVRFLHIDSDLYRSAKAVLALLNERIKAGTVIVFDELCWWDRLGTSGEEEKYEAWREHEWKALREWMAEFGRKAKVLCRNKAEAAAIVVWE